MSVFGNIIRRLEHVGGRIHCFDYIKFFSKTLTKLLVSLTFLFIPPGLFCWVWYISVYEEFNPFHDVLVQRNVLTLNSETELGQLKKLADAAYDFQQTLTETQGNFLERDKFREEEEKKIVHYDDFRSEVSRTFIEKLGIFATLPHHQVCLINQNTVQMDGQTEDPAGAALAIKQADGYEFYALPGREDCKNVYIDQFTTSSSTVENAYVVIQSISAEEQLKASQGEPFYVVIATTSTIVSSSKVVISLTKWIMALAYFLFLFAWSFVFFQVVKIVEYIAERFKRLNREA